MALILEGKKNEAEAEHRDRAWLAWTIAALGRAKRMPSLDDVTGKKKRAPKRKAMAADQMLTIARMWTSAVSDLRRESIE